MVRPAGGMRVASYVAHPDLPEGHMRHATSLPTLLLLLAATAACDDGATRGPDAGPPADADPGTADVLPQDASADTGVIDAGPIDGPLPIQALQDPAHPRHPEEGDPVYLVGAVVTTPQRPAGFWVGAPEGGPFSGVRVYVPARTGPVVHPGDTVTVVGTYAEFEGETEIVAEAIEVGGTAALPPPADVATADICATCDAAEQWEGVRVRLRDVAVSHYVGRTGPAVLAAAEGGPGVQLSTPFARQEVHTARIGDRFDSIVGIVDAEHVSGVFQLVPGRCADMIRSDGEAACPPVSCPEPASLTLEQIKDRRAPGAAPDGCLAHLGGLVVSSPAFVVDRRARFFAQTAAGGPWSGVLIELPQQVEPPPPGAGIRVFGQVSARPETALLYDVGIELDPAADDTATPTTVPVDELGLPWDGVLVRIEDVRTVRTPRWFDGEDVGAFTVERQGDEGMRAVVEDFLGVGVACRWAGPRQPCAEDNRVLNQRFDAIVGVLDWSRDYRILPRSADDLTLRACAAEDADCDGRVGAEDLCPNVYDEGGDADDDGIPDACDLCPEDAGSGEDPDADGVGSACDVCPEQSDPGQADLDGDGVGDACDPDRDGDGVADAEDVCPWTPNPAQSDEDGDGIGDACAPAMHRIVVDGGDDDWDDVAVGIEDPKGDAPPGGVDLVRVRVADDEARLLLQVVFASEVLMNRGHGLRVEIDRDADGTPDFVWAPGGSPDARDVGGPGRGWLAVGFEALPSHRDTHFELAFDKAALGIDPSSDLRIVLREPEGDRVPDAGPGLRYRVGQGELPPVVPIALGRVDADAVRLAVHNVRDDGIFDPGLQPAFERMYQAVAPDVVLAQEIWSHRADALAALMEGWAGGNWVAAPDSASAVVSRLPILDAWTGPRSTFARLDTDERIGRPLVVVNVHLPCCRNEVDRSSWVDQINRALGDALESGRIPAGSGLVIAGDMNMVGDGGPLNRLVSGGIRTDDALGPPIEWGLDPLVGGKVILRSRHFGGTSGSTWRNDDSTFWPSLLDHVIVDADRLAISHHYILETRGADPSALESAGLLESDAAVSDHRMRVVDVLGR
jgi:endonuclease/exonuclease/phosphatase family metal-dependent hydrolase